MNFTDLGISFENDGKMIIDDADKLNQVLQDNPEQIAAFFGDESSPIAAILSQSESFTESGGILSSWKIV